MRKQILQKIIDEKPEAVLVKNKYKVIAGMIKRMFPELQTIPQDKLADICFEAIAGDRDWRMLTEGKDKVNKEIKRQEWIVNNLWTHNN